MADSAEQPRQLTLAGALELAAGLLDQNRLAEAENVLSAVLAAAPRSADGLHFMGILRAQEGRAGEAIDLIRQAIAVAPTFADAYTNLGNIYRSLGRTAEAQAALARAIEIAPDVAEAHLAMADLLRRAGQRAESVPFYLRAIALKPGLAQAHFQLGKVYSHLGKIAERDAVFHNWLALDPQNPAARHMVAAIGSSAAPERASDGYVQYEFDDFADTFDGVMTTLDYKAPEQIAAALAAILKPQRQLKILDAGCGTGLVGQAILPFAQKLVGVDLSPGMMAHARQRGIYDSLVIAELTAYLQTAADTFDVIVCADTFIYFGSLAAVIQGAARSLRPGGVFIFTVEHLQFDPSGAGWRLQPHGRYSQSEPYIRQCLEESGLRVINLAYGIIRLELKDPVAGMTVTAARPG